MLFKKYYVIQTENQTKYGLTKEVHCTIIIFKKWLKNNDFKMYSIPKENLLLQKDLLEH